jgi:hypothetical protein
LTRYLAIILALLAPLAARAQQPPPVSPEAQALMITGWIGTMVQEATNLRAQNAQLQSENAALKAQAAKPPVDPPAKIAPVPNATLPGPTDAPKP